MLTTTKNGRKNMILKSSLSRSTSQTDFPKLNNAFNKKTTPSKFGGIAPERSNQYCQEDSTDSHKYSCLIKKEIWFGNTRDTAQVMNKNFFRPFLICKTVSELLQNTFYTVFFVKKNNYSTFVFLVSSLLKKIIIQKRKFTSGYIRIHLLVLIFNTNPPTTFGY